jgi:hypothetical protein
MEGEAALTEARSRLDDEVHGGSLDRIAVHEVRGECVHQAPHAILQRIEVKDEERIPTSTLLRRQQLLLSTTTPVGRRSLSGFRRKGPCRIITWYH